jgi:hypothetical protein
MAALNNQQSITMSNKTTLYHFGHKTTLKQRREAAAQSYQIHLDSLTGLAQRKRVARELKRNPLPEEAPAEQTTTETVVENK